MHVYHFGVISFLAYQGHKERFMNMMYTYILTVFSIVPKNASSKCNSEVLMFCHIMAKMTMHYYIIMTLLTLTVRVLSSFPVDVEKQYNTRSSPIQ